MSNRPLRCMMAMQNVAVLITPEHQFPANVFTGEWAGFFFFDSDWVLDPVFVESVKALLDVDDGTCACLVNLDSEEAAGAEKPHFCIDRETSPADFQAVLGGTDPSNGWLFSVTRYGCASDKGEWCIYCEQASEIGVVAFRHSGALARYASPIAQLHAARLDEAIKGPLSYGFSDRALSAHWRSELLREYGARSL